MPKHKTNKNGPLLAVAFIGLSVAAALAAYVKFTPADRVPAAEHKDKPAIVREIHEPTVDVTRKPRNQGEQVVLLTPYYEGDQLQFRSRNTDVPRGEDPPVYVVNSFLKDSKVFSSSTRLLSIDVQDGVAHLYFNDGFAETQGTEDEGTVLQGISACLAQFPNIQKALFYANGEQVKTLGSVDLSEPIDIR